jgi:hypothetical protein
MKVEWLVEKVEKLARRYPGLEIDGIEINDTEIVIDLGIEDLKKVLRDLPSGSCAGIIGSGNSLTLRTRWRFEKIGDVLFRTSL